MNLLVDHPLHNYPSGSLQPDGSLYFQGQRIPWAVTEVTNSEAIPHANQKARYWLTYTNGQVRFVLIIKLHLRKQAKAQKKHLSPDNPESSLAAGPFKKPKIKAESDTASASVPKGCTESQAPTASSDLCVPLPSTPSATAPSAGEIDLLKPFSTQIHQPNDPVQLLSTKYKRATITVLKHKYEKTPAGTRQAIVLNLPPHEFYPAPPTKKWEFHWDDFNCKTPITAAQNKKYEVDFIYLHERMTKFLTQNEPLFETNGPPSDLIKEDPAKTLEDALKPFPWEPQNEEPPEHEETEEGGQDSSFEATVDS